MLFRSPEDIPSATINLPGPTPSLPTLARSSLAILVISNGDRGARSAGGPTWPCMSAQESLSLLPHQAFCPGTEGTKSQIAFLGMQVRTKCTTASIGFCYLILPLAILRPPGTGGPLGLSSAPVAWFKGTLWLPCHRD